MPSKVLIAGAGQLGSRYLQGLAGVSQPLIIYVQDISPVSLQRATSRWLEVVKEGSLHKVIFSDNFAGLPQAMDIAIVATAADVRPRVVESIARAAAVQYWIVEKVLAQSVQAVAEIEAAIGNARGAWVNTPRRVIEWHQQIKSELCAATAIQLVVSGGMWGLACNAVHFLDFVQWCTGETLEQIDTSELETAWFEGKRVGFWEVLGTLTATFSGGSVAKLCAGKSKEAYRIQIHESQCSWTIEESIGRAVRSDGREIPGRLSLQSQMTAGLVESLLDTGRCGLPTLAESAELHRVFLEGMLAHWNEHMDQRAAEVPIT